MSASARCSCAVAVVGEDRPRDDGNGRDAVVARRSAFPRRWRPALPVRCAARGWTGRACLCRRRSARRCPGLAVIADRLGDGEDVRFGERAVGGRAAMAAGAEADALVRVGEVGLALVVIAFELAPVDQHVRRCGLAGQGMDCHDPSPSIASVRDRSRGEGPDHPGRDRSRRCSRPPCRGRSIVPAAGSNPRPARGQHAEQMAVREEPAHCRRWRGSATITRSARTATSAIDSPPDSHRGTGPNQGVAAGSRSSSYLRSRRSSIRRDP